MPRPALILYLTTLVNRALLCLPRHKHIKFISQTAILEFKCGDADRGRSFFEGVLREYPKRTDLWSVYLDQEIRLGEVDVIRSLFERAISLSLPPKKMKFLFKKFLEYEKSAGDEERVEYVKQRAMEYAENALASDNIVTCYNFEKQPLNRALQHCDTRNVFNTKHQF